MDTHVNKSGEQNKRAAADSEAPIQGESSQAFTFADNRPQSIAQRKLQEAIMNSPRVQQLKAFQEMANNSVPPKQSNKIQGTPVAQLWWVHHRDSNQSHWEGRREPTEGDLQELAEMGRVRVENVLAPPLSLGSSSSRPNGLFLAAADAAEGAVGAPFPLPPPAAGQAMPQRERITSVAWPHDGQRVAHPEDRRAERTINGGTARAQAAAYGLPDYARAAHAHIQPDHAIPLGEDRENPANRHPSTEAANQQHSTREHAQSRIGRQEGLVIASRRLQGPLPDRPGLYTAMEFGTGFLTGADVRTHRGSVPYFTHQPGRYGDETARFRELETFGHRALASSLRDSGALSREDLPDAMYVPPDRESSRRRRSRSRSPSGGRSSDRRRRLSRSRSRSRSPEPVSRDRSSQPVSSASSSRPRFGPPRPPAPSTAATPVRVTALPTSAPLAAPQVAGARQVGASAAAAAGALGRVTAFPTSTLSAAPQVAGAQQAGASAAAAAGATLSATTSSTAPQVARGTQAAASSSAAAAAAAPRVIAPPAVHNLTAHQMTQHYFDIIEWAQNQGTFSEEFLYVRDEPDAARALLQNAGMGAGDAQAYVDALAVQVRAYRATHGYVHRDIQNAILRQPGLNNQLLAIIRYRMHG